MIANTSQDLFPRQYPSVSLFVYNFMREKEDRGEDRVKFQYAILPQERLNLFVVVRIETQISYLNLSVSSCRRADNYYYRFSVCLHQLKYFGDDRKHF